MLFSLVPFIALLAALLDAILPPDTRADVVGWLLGALPGTTVQTGVEQELAKTGAITSLAGMIAFGALIWTASGMTRSLRVALAVIWGAEPQLAFGGPSCVTSQRSGSWPRCSSRSSRSR